MTKFSGMIGYSQSVESVPGVWVDTITEHQYYGDILRETKEWTNTAKVNDDLRINHRISIVADDFANSNFSAMKYVIWSGVYWKISNIDIQRPRIILSLGGVYNGIKA